MNRQGAILETLQYNFSTPEWLDKFINAIILTRNDRLTFMLQRANDMEFFKDPDVIVDDELRAFVSDIVSLKTTGADAITIREKLSGKREYTNLRDQYFKAGEIDFGEDLFLPEVFGNKLKNWITYKYIIRLAKVLYESSADTSKVVDDKLVKKVTDLLGRFHSDLSVETEFREMELAQIDERIQERRVRIEETDRFYIPTGLGMLDDLFHGGFEPGRLIMPASLTGGGKSAFCAHVAVEAVDRGFSGVFFTLENTLAETMNRLDARVTGYAIKNLHGMSKSVSEKVREFVSRSGRLLVKEFPANTMTVPMMTSYIQQRIQSGRVPKPDFVVVDFLDCVRPTRFYAQRRFELADISRELKKFGVEREAVVISPTQLNRGSATDENPDMHQMAEAHAKSTIADILLILRMTDKERAENKIRIFVAKSRVGPARKEVHCSVDFETMTFDAEKITNVHSSNFFGEGDEEVPDVVDLSEMELGT